MRRIDRLVLGELAAPWGFGVGLFTALLMAGTYLGRLTGFIVGGASPGLVVELLALYLPPLLVKTFSMSMLLAGLLGFGRLSADSEIVALKASGASVPRIVRPVVLASLVVALVTFAFNELIVPPAAARAVAIANELARSGKIGGKPDAHVVIQDKKLVLSITALGYDVANGTLKGVTAIAYDKYEQPAWLLTAPTVIFRGQDDWRIGEGARIVPVADPRAVIRLKGGAWPKELPKPKGTLESLFSSDKEYDAYTLAQLRAKIVQMRHDGDHSENDIRDFEYGYYNKFSVALAALVFGTLGAALGIGHHRSGGTASGFALAVGIIFGYVTLANFMNVWARGGVLPPWAASFAPLCIGIVACGVIIKRRNV